jgi:DNA-3-methyladenine glycosylase II
MLHVEDMYTYRQTLDPVPPFDFNLSARSFSNGDAQIQKYENGRYWQVIRKNGLLIHLSVSALGTIDKPQLLVELTSPEKLSGSDIETALNSVHSIFNLQIDLNSFYKEFRMIKLCRK